MLFSRKMENYFENENNSNQCNSLLTILIVYVVYTEEGKSGMEKNAEKVERKGEWNETFAIHNTHLLWSTAKIVYNYDSFDFFFLNFFDFFMFFYNAIKETYERQSYVSVYSDIRYGLNLPLHRYRSNWMRHNIIKIRSNIFFSFFRFFCHFPLNLIHFIFYHLSKRLGIKRHHRLDKKANQTII